MEKNIALIRGDGIGPEIVMEAVEVLNRVAEIYGHSFRYTEVDMGGNAIDKWGDPLPQAELDKCLASDSVLLGAVELVYPRAALGTGRGHTEGVGRGVGEAEAAGICGQAHINPV